MRNIEERREFWSVTNDRNIRGMTKHVLGCNDIFAGKSLLEIGPGMGGDIQDYLAVCSEVAIADICQDNLDAITHPVEKHFIVDYKTELGREWDVVVAWYVVHHVLHDELLYFLEYMAFHAKEVILFNAPATPGPHNPYTAKHLGDDGMKTMLHDHSLIRGLMEHQLSLDVKTRAVENAKGFDRGSVLFEGRL